MKIIKVLMNQDKSNGIGSGLGNYLCSEILYKSKLSPYRTLKSLTRKDIDNLCYSIKYIIKLSYYNNSTTYINSIPKKFIESHKTEIDNGKYPNYHSDIKFKKNQIFEFEIYGKKIDKLGNEIYPDKIINKGRTTYWVKNIQV